MKTTVWSLAALASGVLAIPGPGNWGNKRDAYDGGWDDSWGSSTSSWGPPVTGVSSSSVATSSSSSTPVSPLSHSSSSSSTPISSIHSTSSVSSSTPVSSSHSTSSSSATPVGPGSYTYSFSSKKTTSSAATSSSPLSSITKSASATASSSSGSAPGGWTTYVTKVTTIYTTYCPGTSTHVSTVTSGETTKPTTLTTTYMTTSTVTSVYTSTIVTSVSSTPVVAPHSSSTPVSPVTPVSSSPVETTVTLVKTIYTTVCPVTQTHIKGGTTLTSTFKSTSTITSEYESTITVSAKPTGTTEYTTVTDVTTEYTTVCPATQTSVSGETTLTSIFQTTSTVTSVYQSTITVTASEWSSSSPGEVQWSTVPWGTTVYSYPLTIPIVFPSTTITAPVVGPTASGNGTSPSGTGKKSASKSTAKASGSVSKKSTISASAVSSYKSTGSVVKPSSTSSKAAQPTTCVPCEGQPGSDPEKWCGYTIHDNSYEVMPKTCKTVEYDLYLTNITIAPDGVARTALVFNGQMPGPTIEANWGDTIVVHLHNQVTANGSSIHFHGTRQNYTNEMDGVPSITQCPLAPGEIQTYTFKASNYGSSWYHSHYSLQLYDGAFGPMIVHGPSSADYDDDETILIQDWNHIGNNELYDTSQTISTPGSGPPTLDTGLINGMNIFNQSGSTIGERFQMTVVSGKTYRLRLVNTAIMTTFKFYLDQHTFQVIAADFVPLTPYTTNVININTGQRYDVLFKADQPVANYWLRADGQQACTTLVNSKDIKAIVSYEGAPAGLPTSTAYTYTEECVDEPLASIVPVLNLPAGPSSDTITESVFIGGNGGTPNLYKWTLSGTTFQSQYSDPTLISIVNNGSVPDYSGNLAIDVPTLGEWVYVIIESVIPVPHPIHLHGHDFQVLAQGYGSYSASTPLNTATPARRDTVLMPGNAGQGGFVVVAFLTDNPGAWLMHCHIGWHSAMGFALQIIENLDGIVDTVKHTADNAAVCSAWNTYATADDIVVLDAGI